MGEIVWLACYPVKSMLGEELGAAELVVSGVAGDRRYGLIDETTGLVASAKNPRLWGALLSMAAAYAADGSVAVRLPDGSVVRGDDPGRDEALSRALGRPVRLAASRPEGASLERLTPSVEEAPGSLTRGRLAVGASGDTFVDFADVHVVTTATLDSLALAHPRGRVSARRFRPNVIVRMIDPVPFVENSWPGRTLRLGRSTAVRVQVPTPRCVVPTLAQGAGLDEDPDVLRMAARLNRVPVLDLGPRTCVGAYASVERTGPLRVGDLVEVA